MIITYEAENRPIQTLVNVLPDGTTINELINFLNENHIKIVNYINYIDIRQKNTIRPIGCISAAYTGQPQAWGKYELHIPYKGKPLNNAIVTGLHIQKHDKSIITIQDNTVKTDEHVPVYYAESIGADEQKILQLIAKDYYDDMVERNKTSEIIEIGDDYYFYDDDMICDCYDQNNPVLYEYYNEIEKAIKSWQDKNAILKDKPLENAIFCNHELLFSKPIDEIIRLMAEQGFDLEPMPERIDNTVLLHVDIRTPDGRTTPFRVHVDNYQDTQIEATPERIKDTFTAFRWIWQNNNQSAYGFMSDLAKFTDWAHRIPISQSISTIRKLDDLKLFRENDTLYPIRIRQMNPETEDCSNPDFVFEI